MMSEVDFEIGSWVVYPSHGVGRLDGIETVEIDGEQMPF
ncbi:MAG: CarD family transcriptional regulator, partial [Alphaproteobacteria bacterium]|nr:CarD family transcriptional regulator [Alphaproteobacteria bacterium]